MKKTIYLSIFLFATVVLAGCGRSTISDVTLTENEQRDRIFQGTVNQLVDTGSSVLNREGRRVLYAYNGKVFFKQGVLTIADGIPTAGSFTLDMTNFTLDNGSERPHQHLMSEDFFDVENYPEAMLVFTDIQATDNPDQFTITADLTIKDVTNDITFTAIFSPDRLQAVAAFEIDRTRRGVEFGSSNFFEGLGDKAIDDMIGFAADIRFVR